MKGFPMAFTKLRFHQYLLAITAAASLGALAPSAHAASASDLDRDANDSLQALYSKSPSAVALSKNAKAILVFPKIIKAGLIFGGSYGEGVLMQKSQVTGYYNSVSASWGWQAGAESYTYVVFLMTDKAVNYLAKTKGWEIGVGPNVVVIDAGAAENLSTSTLKKDAYAFIRDQKGLMASLSLEGTKISRIRK